MFNVCRLYSIPQFLRANFHYVNYNELAFITMKEKKRDSRLFDHVFYRILAEKYKHLQRKFDQWLVLAAIRRSKFHLFHLNIFNGMLTLTLVKNCLFSSQNDISIFTQKYHIQKFHIYARIRKCGKMLLSYIFV